MGYSRQHERHDFDWVSAEYESRLDGAFDALSKQAERDVKQANAIGLSRGGYKLEHKRHSQSRFSLLSKRDDGHVYGAAHFTLDSRHIQVDLAVTSGVVSEFHVTAEMYENGEVRYRINGKGEYLRWQIIRKALQFPLK